jgi:hypothetical protein
MSELSNREVKELQALRSDDGTTSLGVLAEEFLTEPHPAYRALGAFLSDLPSPVLFSMVVLLYAGSHDESEVFETVDELCRTVGVREAAIKVIQEKRPRMDFIEKGISAIGVERLPELLESVERKLAEIGLSTDYSVL